ncbi:Y-family DNA polymerase [Psychromonas sp. MME2]|uniref:Y-family DNA polymerase n=1 Tax=unclassified Psychromonas TaxID=2614957 RepID=UPI00339CFCC1
MYALVDANAFYCSSEQVFRPEWRGKPMVVLSNNDGCIIAANKQAISLGIKKFQPYFKYRTLCNTKGIIVCSSNYELYGDLSGKMMQIIGRFAPIQHIYSIDECFLLFADFLTIPNLIQDAQEMRKAVWKEARLPVCVGLGATMTLAKLANHIAKKSPDSNGVSLLTPADMTNHIFKNISPSEVWGIGRKTNRKLCDMGVNSVTKLLQLKRHIIEQNFNIELLRTIQELNGEKCKGWDETRADKRQIFSTRSVGQRIVNIACLQQALVKHITIAAEKLRIQGSLCGTLMAFVANSPFDTAPRYFKIIKHFTPPTQSTPTLIKAITNDIQRLYIPGIQYYKIGVGLVNLSSTHHQQYDLFNDAQNDNQLMNLVDNVNQKYGRDSVLFASQGVNEKWSMRRQFLTPQYTTNWKDIPKIHC